MKLLLIFLALLPTTAKSHSSSYRLVASDIHYTDAPYQFGPGGSVCIRAAHPLGDSAIELLHSAGITITLAKFKDIKQKLTSTKMLLGYGYESGVNRFMEYHERVLRSDEQPFYSANLYCLDWNAMFMRWYINGVPIKSMATPVILWGGVAHIKPSAANLLESYHYELIEKYP